MRALLLFGAALLVMGGCAGMKGEEEPLSAEAALREKDGKDVGRATLIETKDGVRVVVTGYRLPPGSHGLHVHNTGACQAPDFASAGDHFNPTGKQHGRQNPQGPHAGDLPNLVVAASGEAGIDIVTKAVTLGSGPTSLLAGKGTALVVHERADDEKTDPSGNSGARIACGVITK